MIYIWQIFKKHIVYIYKKYSYTYKKYLGVWRSHRAFRSQSFKQKALKRIFAAITNSKPSPKIYP